MTRNQLEYWKNQETERHNRELEKQGLDSLVIQRRNAEISASAYAETARSNRARELETYRSNLAKEANEALRVQELIRSNKANEQIGYQNAISNRINANAAAQNAGTRVSELQELNRHNLASEQISKDSNPWTSIAGTVRDMMNALTNPDQPKSGANVISAWAEEQNKRVHDFTSNLPATISSVTKIALGSNYNKVPVRTVASNNPVKVTTSKPKTVQNYKGGKVK